MTSRLFPNAAAAEPAHVAELPAPCPNCGGDGGWSGYQDDRGGGDWFECSYCRGTGEVECDVRTLEDLDDEDSDGAAVQDLMEIVS